MERIKKADNFIQMLEDAGYEAFYVGGCVRDLIMRDIAAEDPASITYGDIDVTTDATPEEMEEVFRDYRLIETGIKHGTVTVLNGAGMPVEITTFRTDGDYSDHRHPDSVIFVRDLKEDLQRRDFTINAIAMDRHGNIRDPFGGEADIRRRIIRAVGDPDKRFREDALRIMRALRFAAILEGGNKLAGEAAAFAIEARTEEAMFRNKELLRNVSAERIFVEFKKLIVGSNAGNVIRRYVDILGVIIPELLPMKGFDQRNPYHKYDVLEHCVRAMEVIEIPADAPAEQVYMKIAALLHDVGKPDTFFIGEDGIGHTYGHPARGEEMVRQIMERLKADHTTRARVASLVKYHDLVFQEDDRLLKRWIGRFGEKHLIEILHIKRADNIATGKMSHELEEKFNRVEDRIKQIAASNACCSVKDLAVNGNDVLAAIDRLANIPDNQKGPLVGKVLDQVLNEVIDGALRNLREEQLKRIDQVITDQP